MRCITVFRETIKVKLFRLLIRHAIGHSVASWRSNDKDKLMADWYQESGQLRGDAAQRSNRKRGLRPAPDEDRPWWAYRPWLKNIEGLAVEVYGIAATSRVMGVSVVTQRSWERQGIMPRTPLILTYPTQPHGRRLYTRDMVAALADANLQHGVGPRHRPSPAFQQEVQAAWDAATAALGPSVHCADDRPRRRLTSQAPTALLGRDG